MNNLNKSMITWITTGFFAKQETGFIVMIKLNEESRWPYLLCLCVAAVVIFGAVIMAQYHVYCRQVGVPTMQNGAKPPPVLNDPAMESQGGSSSSTSLDAQPGPETKGPDMVLGMLSGRR